MLTGDWDKGLEALRKLSVELPRMAERETKRAGILARDSVKKYIRSQPANWPKLQAATIARKHSSAMLIDTAQMVNSITYQTMNPCSVFVGVLRTAMRKDTGKPMVNIARVHEYGFMGQVTNSKTGTTYTQNIPPRGFLFPTLLKIEKELKQNWIKAVTEAIQQA